MFYALSHCCNQPVVKGGEVKLSSGNKAGKALDIISGIALIIIGALMASGVMTGSPAAAYVMLTLGGLQLGRHLFSGSICGTIGKGITASREERVV